MDEESGQGQFQYTGSTPAQGTEAPSPQPPVQAETSEVAPLLQWKASEFIDHQKSVVWFLPLTLVAAAITTLTYFLTKDILATIVVATGALAFGIFARQKPRTLSYALFPAAIKIGSKRYQYDDFKSFSFVHDGALYSIFLEPIKRFLPPITLYFPPEAGEQIFNFLADRLPHIERRADPVERLMQKIRF